MDIAEQNLVSVIIVYTDLHKLKEAEKWLDRQTIRESLELIALDNRKNVFSSAAKALNYGAEKANGQILVFMHQDVYLWDVEALESYRSYLQAHAQTIIGAAGKLSDGRIVMDIYETRDKIQRGTRAAGRIFEVETLDECLIAMSSRTWKQLRFDEICCNNWHGYAMDICMANILSGGRNMMVPLEICHDSLGSPENNGFRDTVGRLVRKYHKTGIKEICGCCIQIKCNLRSYYWYRIKAWIKDTIKKKGYGVNR